MSEFPGGTVWDLYKFEEQRGLHAKRDDAIAIYAPAAELTAGT